MGESAGDFESRKQDQGYCRAEMPLGALVGSDGYCVILGLKDTEAPSDCKFSARPPSAQGVMALVLISFQPRICYTAWEKAIPPLWAPSCPPSPARTG